MFFSPKNLLALEVTPFSQELEFWSTCGQFIMIPSSGTNQTSSTQVQHHQAQAEISPSQVQRTRLPSFLPCLLRSLYGHPRPASHPLLLPAIWGRTPSLCWRIIGQTGTLPLPVIAVTENEFHATKRCSAAQFTGTAWRRVTAAAFQCCCTATRKCWKGRLKNRSRNLIKIKSK